jgi:protein involved in temperature-dependent protein secretion
MSAERIIEEYLRDNDLSEVVMLVYLDEFSSMPSAKLMDVMSLASDLVYEKEYDRALDQLDIAYTLAEREYGRGLETDLIDELINRI